MINVLDWEVRFQKSDPFTDENVEGATNEFTEKVEVNFMRIRKEQLKV